MSRISSTRSRSSSHLRRGGARRRGAGAAGAGRMGARRDARAAVEVVDATGRERARVADAQHGGLVAFPRVVDARDGRELDVRGGGARDVDGRLEVRVHGLRLRAGGDEHVDDLRVARRRRRVERRPARAVARVHADLAELGLERVLVRRVPQQEPHAGPGAAGAGAVECRVAVPAGAGGGASRRVPRAAARRAALVGHAQVDARADRVLEDVGPPALAGVVRVRPVAPWARGSARGAGGWYAPMVSRAPVAPASPARRRRPALRTPMTCTPSRARRDAMGCLRRGAGTPRAASYDAHRRWKRLRWQRCSLVDL